MGLYSTQVSAKKLVPLCRQLATSYDAGIPIMKSLDLVASGYNDRQVRDLLRAMRNDLGNGATLAEAAQSQSKYLPSFFIQLLASGERGGKLDVMLNDLANYFEDRLKMQREYKRLMTYPCIQVGAAWFLGTFGLGLVGKIKDMFGPRASGEIDIFAYINEYLRFQGKALVVFAVVFAISVILSRMGVFRWISGAVSTFIWPIASVTRKFALARFFRSMSLLIGSGLHLPRCIESAAAITANPYIERDLLKSVPIVQQGHTLVEAFADSRYMNATAREMLFVGEQSGQLETTLRKVSEYMFAEATHAVQFMTKVFSQVIGLAVGVLIGYIVITFWVTLYGGMLDGLGV
ncbi:MAG: type II secretion system F family protein [Candidatus Hydrogenedentes bacterium]|nr:type II secretion system F family protein [Candidatus Hydrogenedentota bacterium]